MITLTYWVFAAALLLAAIVGALGIVLLYFAVADAEDAPEAVADEEWRER